MTATTDSAAPAAPETGRAWPAPPAEAAFSGLAGEVVQALEPHTEADPVALLLSLLVAFGNLIGRGPHCLADGIPHRLNLFCLLVDDSPGSPRAGSWTPVLRLLETVDEGWAAAALQHGLTSGPGLVHAVRDAVTLRQTAWYDGSTCGSHLVTTDYGVEDKRLLIAETDFSPALRRLLHRDGVLSAVLRAAWDTGHLQLLTTIRARGTRANAAHVSLLGHLTREEMLHSLCSSEAACDFASRFLWARVRRSKLLPEGAPPPASVLKPLAKHLLSAAKAASEAGEITRNKAAREQWRELYPQLFEAPLGLPGLLTSRALPQVLRLSCLYALLDRSPQVHPSHLDAALALWTYCRDSAHTLLAGAPPTTLAEKLLRLLQQAGRAVTRGDIDDLLSHNRSAEEVSAALHSLAAAGVAGTCPGNNGKGRPAELWFASGPGLLP